MDGFWKLLEGCWKLLDGFWELLEGCWKLLDGFWKFLEGFAFSLNNDNVFREFFFLMAFWAITPILAVFWLFVGRWSDVFGLKGSLKVLLCCWIGGSQDGTPAGKSPQQGFKSSSVVRRFNDISF